MTSMWIKRDISPILTANNSFIEILTGPRQSGKSSLLLKLDDQFIELSMDDFSVRQMAQQDPQAFLKQFIGKKILIDEAHLAPEIFIAIKREVDLLKRSGAKIETMFRLTGSNQILIDKNVKESLAGRASYFELNTLSLHEILAFKNYSILDVIFKGGWPELYKNPDIDSKKYLNDYLKTYIEKDIVLSAGIQKQNEFHRMLSIIAARTGQIINYSEIAKDIAVNMETIKDWVSVLARMKIIGLVPPYSTNLSKRLIKSPKLYFLDTGLAVRLQGHSEVAPLLTSPSFGHLFETLVYSEIYKTMINYSQDWKIFHWRSKDKEEIDFYVELQNGKNIFIEVKTSFQALPPIDKFPEVKKVFKNKIPDRILCHLDGEKILGNAVPVKFLAKFLLKYSDPS